MYASIRKALRYPEISSRDWDALNMKHATNSKFYTVATCFTGSGCGKHSVGRR
jgi:hypothetical protein